MISATNISKQFGKLKALDNITVTYPAGECIALIGPNGSGKTTFIKSILGMVVPDSGKILFKGKDIAHDCLYRSDIGYMPQIGRYPENMTIGQVLEMMNDIRNHSGGLDNDLFNDYNFKTLLNKRMRTLSGGTRQKVSAALAFMFNPEVLILDEPTAGLDPVASEILKQKIVNEKKKGKLILITSHVLSELDDIVTQVMYMQDGKMIFYKPFDLLQFETGENKLSKAIATIMQQNQFSDIL
jgi:Cu-processing system ATP-binding protein